MSFGGSVAGMIAILKNNSIRGKRPGFIEISEAKRIKSKSLIKNHAKPKELESIRKKIRRQNKIENYIYAFIGVVFVFGLTLLNI